MLRKFYPWARAESVFTIDYEKLYERGFRGLMFDIDNTLVHHSDDATPEVEELFRALRRMGFRTLLLTNNSRERVERFVRNIDTLYLCEAGKPGPEGYLKAAGLLGLEREELVCIGDQIFTDILGANRSGMASVLVRFIRLDREKKLGKRRRLEQVVLWFYQRSPAFRNRLGEIEIERGGGMPQRKRKLFCEMNPLFYAISEQKGIIRRNWKDMREREPFAVERREDRLPNLVSEQSSVLIKRAKGIDLRLQENKAVNIRLACSAIHGMVVRPGEVFSFWRTVGKTTRRKGYRDGRILREGRLGPGIGGGLCNLSNTIHWLVLHSPLEVVEFHSHSDALAPDHGERVPFSSGTSVSYNYIDYRFRNNTDQNVQLLVWCDEEKLYGELRSERAFPQRFELVEEDHHFHQEDGKYYRISQIYKVALDWETGETVDKQLVLDNHSEVMFDYELIPKELIR